MSFHVLSNSNCVCCPPFGLVNWFLHLERRRRFQILLRVHTQQGHACLLLYLYVFSRLVVMELFSPCSSPQQILVEPGSTAAVTKYGNIRIDVRPIPAAETQSTEPQKPPAQPHTGSGTTSNQEEKAGQSSVTPAVSSRTVGPELDVVQLSIFNNRFMGIAEQMGRTLQRTSISTNIKVSV